MRKIVSWILSVCIFMSMIAFSFGLNASAMTLSADEISKKNYPIPDGYEVNTLISTFDDASQCKNGSLSNESGTYYDTASLLFHTSGEKRTSDTTFKLDGVGLMFWYKSSSNYTMRIRGTDHALPVEATLPASPDGRWITYYYFGRCDNFSFKTDSNSDIRSTIELYPNRQYYLNLMGNDSNIYIDEIFTIKPILTAADTYDSDEQAFKFSKAKEELNLGTGYKYFDDGSVILGSKNDNTASSKPVNINYNIDKEQFIKAVNIAKNGSGYLQIAIKNIQCHNKNDEVAEGKVVLTFNGIGKQIKKNYKGDGISEVHLLKVDDIEDFSELSTLNVSVSGSNLMNVSFQFSPITVYHYPTDGLIYQAEDLNPKVYSSGKYYDVTPEFDEDKNRVYVSNTNDLRRLVFTLPKELEVGEYEVVLNVAARSTSSILCVAVNNLRQLCDVNISDSSYLASGTHVVDINIGKIQITKNYSDGPSELAFYASPKKSGWIKIDYIKFIKTDTAVEAEPSSNFEIKEYPEMDNYEVLKVLDNYDEFIAGDDARFYQSKMLAGYVGDGNAFNLNSMGSFNGGGVDSNYIWKGAANSLTGDGLRFWYKSSRNVLLRFAGTDSFLKEITIPANSSGAWYIVPYSSIVSNGNVSRVTAIVWKVSGTSYVDELHIIQEKEGDIKYQLNGDGTASVIGYNLRLGDEEIAGEYQGCPVVSIKEGAFKDNINLLSVKLPDTIKTIEANAFSGCLNLSKINLENITTIGDNAFNNCNALSELNLSQKADSISKTAFSDCAKLYINATDNSFAKQYCIDSRVNYKCRTSDMMDYFVNFSDNGDFATISGYSGSDVNIIIPQTIDGYVVNAINNSGFEGNSNIKSVKLSGAITEIKSNAFKDCISLVSVNLDGVEKIDSSAFENCTALTTVTTNDSLISIAEKAFSNCSEIKEFYFGDNITSVADSSFKNCALTAKLSEDSYANRNSYSYIYVNKNSLKYYPTTDSDFKYYVIKYIATITDYVGSDEVITMPESIDGYDVENVGQSAFEGKTFIKSVIFNNIININDKAFYNCTSLSNISLSNSVRTIGAYAFAGCSSLKKVKINTIVNYDISAFDSTTTLEFVQTDFIRSALDYVSGMTAGWNLGNTIDGHNHNNKYGSLTVEQHERLLRGKNYVSQDLFNMVAKSFNTIRIPITWNVFINPDNDYKIDDDFMDRIEEIVNMCYKAGFEYIIINTHHDSDYYFNVHLDQDIEKAGYVLGKVWEQISDRFESYDEKLIFESMNEIRSMDVNNNWAADWNGNEELYERYNYLNKKFYSTVRNSGVNNSQRYLLLQTYGGMRDQKHLNALWLPTVDEDNHIIASIHWYIDSPTLQHYLAIPQMCKRKFVDNGIPCVIGEAGLAKWRDDDYRVNWVNNLFFPTIMENELKAIIWDDHGDFCTTNVTSTTDSVTGEVINQYSWKYPNFIDAIYNITNVNTEKFNVVIDGVSYQSSRGQFPLPESDKKGFACYTDGTNLYSENQIINIDKDIELTSVTVGDVKMVYGASMRLKENGGIRFSTVVDVDKINYLRSIGATVELGTLIAPKNLLDGELTFEDAPPQGTSSNYKSINVKYTSDKYYNGSNIFVGSIINVLQKNISRQFVGRGYVKVSFNGTEKVIYADYANGDVENNSRSIGLIAFRFKNDANGGYSSLPYETKKIVDYYVAWYNKDDPFDFDKF